MNYVNLYKTIIVSIILLSQLLLITARKAVCEDEFKPCVRFRQPSKYDKYDKYLFYDVNPTEGFNLRRDVYMRFANFISEMDQSDLVVGMWRLVLPPWYGLIHWKHVVLKEVQGEPVPWSTYFDVSALRAYVPVMELHEMFDKFPTYPLTIDVLYILENYPDPFEGGVFQEKWEISDSDCKYNGNFWGYYNVTIKEVVCIKFQGKISNLAEVINLNQAANKVMFAHGEIPLHDEYGTKLYWACRKSMKFNPELVDIAKSFIRNILDCDKGKCSTYLGVHWRRQDFAYRRQSEVPSVINSATQIDEFLKKHHATMSKIFIATDASDREMKGLEKLLKNMGYKIYFYKPTKALIEKYKDGGPAIIEQIICAHSAFFIGTHESTYTLRIQEEREILGFDPVTTFNRLCPDKGKCEKPSMWTIQY